MALACAGSMSQTHTLVGLSRGKMLWPYRDSKPLSAINGKS
jgi:hypothetical protein